MRKRLGYQVSRLARAMKSRLENQLIEHDMTRVKWVVLCGIVYDNSDSPSALAHYVGISRPAISRLLKTMETEGLIERSLMNNDGRSRRLKVTDHGQRKLEVCTPIAQRNTEHFANKLSEAQLNELQASLEILLENEAVLPEPA